MKEKRNTQELNARGKGWGGGQKQNIDINDAYRCCALPRMRLCTRISNVEIANTE
jgi:hypothetical protein